MSVLSVQLSSTGFVPNTSGLGIGMTQQTPTPIFINTNDTLAAVTTTGYLNQSVTNFQYPYTNWQMAEVYTTDSGVVWLRVNITTSAGHLVYSLVAPSESGSITTPTVANQIAYATNTLGTIAASGLSTALFNAGNISAGLSTGTAGILESYPGAATSGKLIVAAVTNSGGNFNTTISNAASVGQSQVVSIPDTGATTANFIMSKLTGTQHITVGALQVDAGVISSGISTGGTAGGFIAYPATTTNGSLRVVPVGNAGNFAATISNISSLGQASVYTIPDPGAATANFLINSGVQSMAAGSNVKLDKGTGTESSNAVTISKQAGVITTTALTTAGGATEIITLTNTLVATSSVVVASIGDGTNTATQAYTLATKITGASTVVFTITNTTAATALNGTLVIQFAVF